MKKLISMLLILALLCCSLLTAAGEAAGPVITVNEFKSAMNRIAKEFIGWDMEWTTEDDFVIGNLGNNPVLLSENGYVTYAMVSFDVTENDDMQRIANVFIITSALVAACPAVRDGYSVSDAPDMVFGDLKGMLASLSIENITVTRTLYNMPAMLTLSTEDDGSISMVLLLTFTNPHVGAAPASTGSSGKYVVITADSGKIRTEASLSGGLIRTACKGETFELIRTSGDWYIISVDGRTGYLHSGVAEIR